MKAFLPPPKQHFENIFQTVIMYHMYIQFQPFVKTRSQYAEFKTLNEHTRFRNTKWEGAVK